MDESQKYLINKLFNVSYFLDPQHLILVSHLIVDGEGWQPQAQSLKDTLRRLGMASPAFIPSHLRRAGFTIPKAFPGYGVAFAETSGFEAAT